MMEKHRIFGVLISTSFLVVALQVVRISTTASCGGIPSGNVGNSLPPPAFPDFMAIFQESIKLIISENQTLPDFNSPDSQCLQRLDLTDFNCRIRSNDSVDLEGVCNPPTTIVAPSTPPTSFLPSSSAGIRTTSTTSSRDLLTSVTSTSPASRKVTTSTGSVVTSRSEKTTVASAEHPSSSGRTTTDRSSSMHTSVQFIIPLVENSRVDPQNNGVNILALAIALPIACAVLSIVVIVCLVMIRRRKNVPKGDGSAENPAVPGTDNSNMSSTNEAMQAAVSQPVDISQHEFDRMYDQTPGSAAPLWPYGDSSTDDNIFFEGVENRGYTDEEMERLKNWKSSVNDMFSHVLSMMQTSSPSLHTSGSFRNTIDSDSPQRIDSGTISSDDNKSFGVKSVPKNGAISIPTWPAVSVNLMRFSSNVSPGKEATTPSSSTSSHNDVFDSPSTPRTLHKPTTPGSPREQPTPQSNTGGPLFSSSAIEGRAGKAKRPWQLDITPKTLTRAPAPITPSSAPPPYSPGNVPITPSSLPLYLPAQPPLITTSLPVPLTPATPSSSAPPTPITPSSPAPTTPATPSSPAPPTPATPSLPALQTPATPSSSVPPPYEEALRRSRTTSATSELSISKEQGHSKVRNNSNRD